MTGEITLRGEVLPIGGLKEKLLAAHRGGITTVMIPVDNEKDLTEIPDNIKGKLDIRPVKWIDEVLEIALAVAADAAAGRGSGHGAVPAPKSSNRRGARAAARSHPSRPTEGCAGIAARLRRRSAGSPPGSGPSRAPCRVARPKSFR